MVTQVVAGETTVDLDPQVVTSLEAVLDAMAQTRRRALAGVRDRDFLEVLRVLTEVRAAGDAARDAFILAARRSNATWQEIGDALGVDRQVVWRKYSKHEDLGL